MIRQLVAALAEAGVETDAQAIADALWLMRARRDESVDGDRQGASAIRSAPTEPRPPDAEPRHPADSAEAVSERIGGRGPGGSAKASQAVSGPGAVASSITLRRARALPGALELGRALRPLKQRHPSKRHHALDVEATVEYFCDTGVLTPVMRPGAERWFDVDVLIDVGASMAVWQETGVELVSLLERHGAFREVRQWTLDQIDGKVRLSRATGVHSEAPQLVDPGARRLTMVVTDCIGPMWYQAPIWDAIRGWGLFSPVVIVTMLPPRLWPRTALGSSEVVMRSHQPGTANRSLDAAVPWWWPSDDPAQPSVPVPVITLEAGPVAAWARMVMGAGGVEVPGVFATPPPVRSAARTGRTPPDAEERVRRFRVTVSPIAYRLAVYLSAALRGRWGLALARVVQEAMLPDSSQVHLAEVVVGGLVRRAEPHAGSEEPMYEFVDGVVNVLRRSLTSTEALGVLQAVGGYIERETGSSPGIAAMLLGESAPADVAEQFEDVQAGAADLIEAMGLARTNSASWQATEAPAASSIRVPLSARVVEVIADLGEAGHPRYRYGSGCVVAGRTVLTAAHVVEGAVSVKVRDPARVLHETVLDPEFVGDIDGPGPDLALVEIAGPWADVPAMGLAAVERDSVSVDPVERCHVIGYPAFMEREAPDGGRFRETADAFGHLPVLSGLLRGLLSVQVSSAPRPLPPAQVELSRSEWSGMSGGPVVADGLLLGVVTEHAPREGTSTITATPLTALENDPAHPSWGPGVADPGPWWARLGASGAQALRRLSALGPEPLYWATVREIHQRTGILIDRQQELAEISSFTTGTEGYRWLVGEAWSGKTSLLAEAVTALRGECDVVCYFLSRRAADATSSRFLDVVIPQLAYLLLEDPPAADRHQFLDLWERAAERAHAANRPLLLVVDGLDEDLLPPGLPSVAARLPWAVGGRTHVLVSSRPRPQLPRDVPPAHPLAHAQQVRLEPFVGARDLAALARSELNDILRRDDNELTLDVLGLLAAAGGPLTIDDLAALTAVPARRVRRVVDESAARTLQAVGSPDNRRYQFVHESLLQGAQADAELNSPEYRARIERWADQWQEADWPVHAGEGGATPRYLFETYPWTLVNQPTRLAGLASDIGWVSAAVQTVGVDQVLAVLDAAQSADPARADVSALLAVLQAQASNLGPPQSSDQPGYVLRQLATQAAELGEDRLAADARARLQALPKYQEGQESLAPVVTGVSPPNGPVAGGTDVIVTGSGFTGATKVSFGTVAAPDLAVFSDTQLTATSPPVDTGETVDVMVATSAGTSRTTPADQYTYVATNALPPAGVQLPKLRDCKMRLSALLEAIDISPDSLDPQAGAVHQELVIPAYKLMSTEVARAFGSRWTTIDRRRFTDRYRAVANKWPAYRKTLAELERARDLNMSVIDLMTRLERPRSNYISALLSFYHEFSGTLDFFFPPETGSAQDSVPPPEPQRSHAIPEATRLPMTEPLIYSMRDLNQQTARVMAEIEKVGKPAFITSKGSFVAIVTPVEPGQTEPRILAEIAQQIGKPQHTAFSDDVHDDPIYSMRDLNQQTARLMAEIEKVGKPAFITSKGSMVAIITPLEAGQIESKVLAEMAHEILRQEEA